MNAQHNVCAKVHTMLCAKIHLPMASSLGWPLQCFAKSQNALHHKKQMPLHCCSLRWGPWHWQCVLVPSCMGTQDQVGIGRHAGSSSLLHTIIVVHIILKSISGVVEAAVVFLLSCHDFGFNFWFIIKRMIRQKDKFGVRWKWIKQVFLKQDMYQSSSYKQSESIDWDW